MMWEFLTSSSISTTCSWGTDDQAPFAARFTAPGGEGQTHVIHAVAYDYGGNVGQSQLVTVINQGPIRAPLTAVTYVSSCALVSDRSVRCWGDNRDGILGDGTTANSYTPVEVSILQDVVDIAGAIWTMCAVRADGTVWCWGDGSYGALGNGSFADALEPVQVLGISNATEIALGGAHACALLTDGTVSCWGYNVYGQLGDGTTSRRATPAPVTGLSGSVVALGVGHYHTCALLDDGTVECWGYSAYGVLGCGVGGAIQHHACSCLRSARRRIS